MGEGGLYFSCRMGLPKEYNLAGQVAKVHLREDVGFENGFWLTAYGAIFGSHRPRRFHGAARVALRCRLGAR